MWFALSVSRQLDLLWLKKSFQHWFWKRSSKRTFTMYLLFEKSTCSSLCLFQFRSSWLNKTIYWDTHLFMLVL